MQILVVDDNPGSLQSLCLVLQDMGHSPTGISSPSQALQIVEEKSFPLIITDIRMPQMDGLELLAKLKAHPTAQSSDVVLVTGHADMTTAVAALRQGAYDYLNKPINIRELIAVVDRSAEHQALLDENCHLKEQLTSAAQETSTFLREDFEHRQDQVRAIEGVGSVIAESKAMQELLDEALIFHSDPSVPVLLEGETGTGKEIFAKYIHHGNGIVKAPFLAINCSAIPHELFESELFGHEPGAFTGSRAEGAIGKLEQAQNGTLFLDEVAELPLSLQPKLLRVLEERSFYRVGGVKKTFFFFFSENSVRWQ